MPRQGEENRVSKKDFKGEEIEWREKSGGKAPDFEEFSQGHQKNVCSFDKKWEENVAWDNGWKLMNLNWDVGSVIISRRWSFQDIFFFKTAGRAEQHLCCVSMGSARMPSSRVRVCLPTRVVAPPPPSCATHQFSARSGLSFSFQVVHGWTLLECVWACPHTNKTRDPDCTLFPRGKANFRPHP